MAEKPADTAKDAIGKTAEEAARDAAEKARNTTTIHLVQQTADTAQDLAGRAADAAQRIATLPSRAASEMLRAESDLASLWVELGHEQIEHNLEMMRRLGAIRDWREAAEIQNAFFQDSLTRLAKGMDRHFELAGGMLTRLFAEDEARKAA